MAPLYTLESYRAMGRNAAGYALGQRVGPVPTELDNFARAKLIVQDDAPARARDAGRPAWCCACRAGARRADRVALKCAESAGGVPRWDEKLTTCSTDETRVRFESGAFHHREEFFEVCKEAGVTRLASVSGDIDLATHDGQFLARILGAVAKKESDDKSRRIRRKHEELAQAGKVAGGGTRPYGYEVDRRTVRESEAVIVRECARRLLAGEALRAICADLNERGVATVTGAPWKTQTLRRMLMSPASAASASTAARSSRRRSGRRSSRPRRRPASGRFSPIPRGGRTRRHAATCSSACCAAGSAVRRSFPVRPPPGSAATCARGGRTSAAVGTSTSTPIRSSSSSSKPCCTVLTRPSSPPFSTARGDPDAERAQAEIEQAQAQLDQLASGYGNQAFGLSEWLAARKPIEQRLTQAKRQLARLSRVSVLEGHAGHAPALRERWPDLPLTRQHAIVAAVLDHVVVGPGRRGYNRSTPPG